MERSPNSRPWQWLIPLALIGVLVVGLWPAFEVLGSRWLKFDESYSHGYLLLVVSLVLIVRKWLLVRPVVGLYPLWLIPLLGAALVYLAGTLLLMEALQQVALLPLLFGTLLLVWGWRQASAFFLPLGILLFAIPVWDYLSWPLQLITVAVNQFLLSWLDIEFVVEGVFVYFPGVGAFEIAHGCSGLRYLLVGLTLSTLYGELNLSTVRNRIYLMIVGALLALAANWIRVFVIIYVGYESNMTSPLINAHDYFGWWVFAGTLVPLFFFARALENREGQAGGDTPAGQVDVSSSPRWRWLLGLGLVPVAFFSLLSWSAVPEGKLNRLSEAKEPSISLVDPEQWLPLFRNNLRGWHPVMQRPDRSRVDVYMERTTGTSGTTAPLELLTGLYTYEFQRPGGELVQYRNRLYDDGTLIPERTYVVDAGEGLSLRGITLKYRQSDVRVHVAYGYYVEGRWETNDLQAKLAQLPGVFNSRSDASLVVAAVTCEACDAQETLDSLFPAIRKNAQDHLDRTYSGKAE